jgi:hypothetical protein
MLPNNGSVLAEIGAGTVVVTGPVVEVAGVHAVNGAMLGATVTTQRRLV